MIGNLFNNLLITDYYKYILLVFGFTFIFSIFWPVQILDNTKIFIASIGSIIYGIAIWILQNYLHTYVANKHQEYEHFIYKSGSNSMTEFLGDQQKKKIVEYLDKNNPVKFTKIYGAIHLIGFIIYVIFLSWAIL